MQRSWRDRASSVQYQLAPTGPTPADGRACIHLRQPIFKTSGSVAKVHNLRLATRQVEAVLIPPGRIFSFWKAIGSPSGRNGYRKGRNIINGRLQTDYGGGLCQLAGLLYHLGLQAGLTIVERHPHSLDLYEEHERYSPLGADATVVYGYKDLRLQNPHSHPIWFRFQVAENELYGALYAKHEIPLWDVLFERAEPAATSVTVATYRQKEQTVEYHGQVTYQKG